MRHSLLPYANVRKVAGRGDGVNRKRVPSPCSQRSRAGKDEPRNERELRLKPEHSAESYSRKFAFIRGFVCTASHFAFAYV